MQRLQLRQQAHVLQKPEDQVLRTRSTGGRHGSTVVSVWWGESCGARWEMGAGAECWQLTIGCVMIFWTLDAMALRDEAYLTSAWQQHSRSGSGRGRGAWKAPAGAPQSDSGALRYRRLLLAGREDADT